MNDIEPTKLQKATIEILAKNPKMPVGKAMIKAGYAESTSTHPKQKLVDSRGGAVAIEQFKDLLRGRGITEEKLAEKYAEWLDAKKVNNSLTEPDRLVPDYQTQLKTAEMIREDFGLKSQGTTVSFNFNQIAGKQKQEYGI